MKVCRQHSSNNDNNWKFITRELLNCTPVIVGSGALCNIIDLNLDQLMVQSGVEPHVSSISSSSTFSMLRYASMGPLGSF